MTDKRDSILEEKFPRPGSSLYKFTQENEEKRIRTLKKWKRMNKYLILPFYRVGLLPALGFGRIFLLLKTVGRTTGKTRRTPLEYHRINGVIHIFSGRGEASDWLKNLIANPDKVGIRHGFHWYPVRPEIVESFAEKKQIMQWYITKHERSARFLFGWNPDKDDLETTDFTQLIKLLVVIRLSKIPEDNT